MTPLFNFENANVWVFKLLYIQMVSVVIKAFNNLFPPVKGHVLERA